MCFFLARLPYSLTHVHEADKMPDTALSVQVTTTLSLIPEKPGPATQLVSLDNNLENAGFESRLPGKEEGAPCRPPSHHPPPGTRPRAASSGSGRLPGALLPAATGGQETPPRRQFVVHKVSSKSLLTSGLTQSGVSRQISLPASQSSTPPRGSRPPSRPASRPTSRPASKPPSRAPSPGRIAVDQEDELGELPQKLAKLKPRFSVLAVEGERVSSREKSPSVSFNEERQYQTVHAGCEIPVKAPVVRERTRSGRFQRLGGRPSVIDWGSKFPWSKERRSSGSGSKAEAKGKGEPVVEEGGAGRPSTSGRLSPKSRPRSKSDRFARPTRRQVLSIVLPGCRLTRVLLTRWWTCTSRLRSTGHLDLWAESDRSTGSPRCPSPSLRTNLQRFVVSKITITVAIM